MDDHFPQYLSNSEADLLITIEREMSDESRAFVEQKKREAYAEGRIEGLAKCVLALVQKLDISLDKAIDMIQVESSDRQEVLKQIEILSKQ